MTTGSHSEPCINWPCAKGAGHAGPCGTSRDDLTSKQEIARQLREWYESGWIRGNTLKQKQAELLWAAIGSLTADEPPPQTSKERFPFYGHDDGLVIEGPDTGFKQTPMTPAQLAAREPALAIAQDIYRFANYAGVCYVELWGIIAKAIQGALDARAADEPKADDLSIEEIIRKQRELSPGVSSRGTHFDPPRLAEPPSDDLAFPLDARVREVFGQTEGTIVAIDARYEVECTDGKHRFYWHGQLERVAETKDAPPPPPQPPPKRVIGEYAPGFRPRDADETSPVPVTTWKPAANGLCEHCGLSWFLHIVEDEQGRKDVCTSLAALGKEESNG